MKKISIAIIIGLVAFAGVACSSGSGGTDAKSLYGPYVSKYGDSIKEIGTAFGTSADLNSMSFDQFIAQEKGQDCSGPITSDQAGVTAVFLGPTLQKHGQNVIDFINDTNAFNKALESGGYCIVSTSTSTSSN